MTANPTVTITNGEEFDDKMENLQGQCAAARVRNCDIVMEKITMEWGPKGSRKMGNGEEPGMSFVIREISRNPSLLPLKVTYDLGSKVKQSGLRVPIKTKGQVLKGSKNCVVSWPGDHAFEWNQFLLFGGADSACSNSTACVFLDENAGPLHSTNPDQPSGCMCSWLYGNNPEVRPQLDKKGRAPWGCMWFAKWCENVQKAVDDGQELWCFYTLFDKNNFVYDDFIQPMDGRKYFAEEERLLKSGKVRKYIGNSQQAEVRWIKEKYGIDCRAWPIHVLFGFMPNFNPQSSMKISKTCMGCSPNLTGMSLLKPR